MTGSSGPLYTRNGSFKILPSGELANGDGYTLRSTSGGTINVVAGKQINITKEGIVQQDNQFDGVRSPCRFVPICALGIHNGLHSPL